MGKGEVQSEEALLAIINYRLLKGNPGMPPAGAAIKKLVEMVKEKEEQGKAAEKKGRL